MSRTGWVVNTVRGTVEPTLTEPVGERGLPSDPPEKDSGLDTILSLFQLNPPSAEEIHFVDEIATR